MQGIKIAARYRDGALVKGTTHNFTPQGPSFHVLPTGQGSAARPTKIRLTELKAVFFVDSYEGNPAYEESKKFDPLDGRQGQRLSVIFEDGESIVGTVYEYNPSSIGFFLFPADSQANNQKVFVVNASVNHVKAA